MQVTSRSANADGYTTYTLEAVIEQQRYVANHVISDAAYAALNTKDKNDLIESQLWQHLMHQLMHHIEHHLRKTAYANAKDSHR